MSHDPTAYKDTFKPTQEPTHIDVHGRVTAGASDPRSVINKAKLNDADAAWHDLYDTKEQRNRYSANSPHIAEPYSPLEILVFAALRRYGDMHPGTVDGEVMMMFTEFGNLVIEDLRAHPYWEGVDIDYYTHPSEIRPIPDPIMVTGLLYHYSIQQQSNKVEAYGPMYFKGMNRILFNRKYGNGKIELSPVDRGTGNEPSGAVSYDARRNS
jgi:hypothetical protein